MAYTDSVRPMLSRPDPLRLASTRLREMQARSTSDAPWRAVDQRLSELAALPPNWNDEDAPVISPLALNLARQLLSLRPQLTGVSDLFPSPDGGVLIEYVRGSWDLSVEISPTGTLEIFGFEIGGSLKLYPLPYLTISVEFLEVLDGVGGPSWE